MHDGAMTKDEATTELRWLASLGGELPNAKARAIDRATRMAGMSRREVAEALGISVQALGRFIERKASA